MDAPVFDIDGNELRREALPSDVFGVEPSRAVMHQALVRQLANARQGTHSTQDRSDVDLTTKKWYRQKHTGRARHGSRAANLFVGGNVAHGPHPRSHRKRMPRKMRQLALRSALAVKAAEEAVVLVDGLAMDAPKTRRIKTLVDRACGGGRTLVLLPPGNDNVELSIRNLTHVHYLKPGYLNVRDVLGCDRLLVPVDALAELRAHLGTGEGGPAGGDEEVDDGTA